MRMRGTLLVIASAVPFFAGCRWIAGVQQKDFVDHAPANGGGAGSGGTLQGGGGSAGAGDTGGSAGAAPICLAQCGGVCTDTLTDPKHCGACNHACTNGVTCDGGICGRSLFRAPGGETPCATKPDGSLHCWGLNDWAQAFQAGASDPLLEPAIASQPKVRYAAGGRFSTCALTTDGAVYCVGDEEFLGAGSTANDVITAPHQTISAGVVELSGAGNWDGGSQFCARTASGQVECWGAILGCSVMTPATTPTPVAGLEPAVQISSGAAFACALLADGTVSCWGGNCHGELGQSDLNAHAGAVKVPGLSAVTTIGTGVHHVCAATASAIYCWGDNVKNQVAAGVSETEISTPTAVPNTGMGQVIQLAGGIDSTCALTVDGDVYCWGLGAYGMMADGNTYSELCANGGHGCTLGPVKATSIGGAVEIALGYASGVARLSSGGLVAWGADDFGQLGNGTQNQNASIAKPVHSFP